MKTTSGLSQFFDAAATEYQTPELVVIGDVSDVVLGVASGGFDGQFQMTEYAFEFLGDGHEE